MRVKLAVPSGKFINKLYQKINDNHNVDNVKVISVPEPDNYDLLIRKQVDAALISPLNYAEALKKADLRIIPATCIAAAGYTGLASILFNSDTNNIKTVAIQYPRRFLHRLAPFILIEKYGFYFNTQDFSDEGLHNQSANAIIIEGAADTVSISLDITEEWFDLFEMPLTLYFWACWADAYPEAILDIINHIGMIDEPEEIIREQTTEPISNYQPRQGSIFLQWNDEIKTSMEATLHFLYYHQLIKDIPAIKIHGQD